MCWRVQKSLSTTRGRCECELRALKYDYVMVYIDDVVIYSRSFEEHLKHIDETISRLCGRYGLRLKASKCHFARAGVECLGHLVSEHGVRPSPKKTRAIAEMTFPKDVTGMRSFLGACSFYRQYVRNFAAIPCPLNELLKDDAEWPSTPTEEQLGAFNGLKAALVSGVVLQHPDWNQDFHVYLWAWSLPRE